MIAVSTARAPGDRRAVVARSMTRAVEQEQRRHGAAEVAQLEQCGLIEPTANSAASGTARRRQQQQAVRTGPDRAGRARASMSSGHSAAICTIVRRRGSRRSPR